MRLKLYTLENAKPVERVWADGSIQKLTALAIAAGYVFKPQAGWLFGGYFVMPIEIDPEHEGDCLLFE